MLLVKAGGLVVEVVGLGEDLKSGAVGADIVEEKLGTS